MTRIDCVLLLVLAIGLSDATARADEAADVRHLKDLGAKVAEVKGVATGCEAGDCTKYTSADYQAIGRLTHLKTLSFGLGLTDDGLNQLAALANLESFGSNGMQVTDAGLKPLARLTKLQSIAFFHPGKSFSGSGLAALAELPKLEKLTVAGSMAFGDEGLAAVARLPHLKSFRTWHAGGTNEGVKKLAGLKELESLVLGQRLTYTPPPCPNDDTVAILAGFSSLKVLDLNEARLSRAALLKLQSLPRLGTLKLTGVEIPEAELKQLKGDLPKTAIAWSAPSEANAKRIKALFGK